MITAITGLGINATMLLLVLNTSPLSVTVASTTKVSQFFFFILFSDINFYCV
jgi:hypothetical protein